LDVPSQVKLLSKVIVCQPVALIPQFPEKTVVIPVVYDAVNAVAVVSFNLKVIFMTCGSNDVTLNETLDISPALKPKALNSVLVHINSLLLSS
jgi:hypothetical protein